MSKTAAIRWGVAVVAALLVSGAPIGCNVAGPIAYFIGGLPKVPAAYEIQNRPTVVYVDDRANVIPSNARVLRMAIADKLSEVLMVNKVLTPETMISPRDAFGAVLARDRHSELLPIDAIGREVGAEQIIYIEMIALSGESMDGLTPRPTATCRVRILDVVARERLFPDPDGQVAAQQINAAIPAVDPAAFRSPSTRLKVHRALCEALAVEVGKLFYEHESVELGGRLNPR